VPETLRQLVSRGPVDASTALHILGQLLKTLALDHWRGIVYGAITPESIVLTTPDEATLADSGMAHTGDHSAPAEADAATGNSGYMAPEQINGDPADERTDIFVLGVVAYEMLTGKHPFGASDGLSASAVKDRILHETPLEIPETILATLPQHIPPVLGIALAKDPKDRFADAESFLEALKGPAAVADVVVPDKHSLPSDASPPLSRPKRRWIIIFALVGLVVIALVVWLLVAFGGNSGSGSSATVTSGGTTTAGQSVLAIATNTTATSVATTTTSAAATIATTTSTAIITTTTITAPTRSEQTDSRLVYVGTWTTAADGSASGGSFSFANSTGTSVTVAFEGTYLAWIAKRSPAYGKAAVMLDGKDLGTIDLYDAATGWQKVWGTGTLDFGLHTVTIAWTGTKNTAATGANISVDAFDVMGSLTQVP
jgi:serine/threonine protein kinase